MPNPFAEQYSKLLTNELIEIISRKADYQPLAVEAAKEELARRNITEEEFNKGQQLADAKKQYELDKKLKVISFENKVKSITVSVVNEINPIQKDKPGPQRLINLLSFTLSFIFVYDFIKEFWLIKAMVKNIGDCDMSCTLELVPLFLTPIAIALFWGKRKIGWIMVCFLISLTTCILLLSFIKSFDIAQIVSIIIPLAFYSSIIWIMNKDDIRRIYNINKNDALIPSFVSLLVALIMELAY